MTPEQERKLQSRLDRLLAEIIAETERTMAENAARRRDPVEKTDYFELAKEICVDPFRKPR